MAKPTTPSRSGLGENGKAAEARMEKDMEKEADEENY
jgi:hypothetical protein